MMMQLAVNRRDCLPVLAQTLIFKFAPTQTAADALNRPGNANYKQLLETAVEVQGVNRFSFPDKTVGWAAAPQYANFGMFIADFYLSASSAPELFTPAQIKNVYRKFLAAADAHGNLPISISTSAAASLYYSGLDKVQFHTGGDAIWCVPLLAQQQIAVDGDTSTLASDLPIMEAALAAVPRSSNGLVNAGTAPNIWISWGFQDGVQKSGDDLVGSIFLYMARQVMVFLYGLIGDTNHVQSSQADAASIVSGIANLYDSGSGMFFAASVQNKQIDIAGSAMAAMTVATPQQQSTVQKYLVANEPTLFNSGGYCLDSPTPWAFANPLNNYDNNYWSWANYWILKAINVQSPMLAQTLLAQFASNPSNTNEYFVGNTPSGAIDNMESPMGTLRFARETQ